MRLGVLYPPCGAEWEYYRHLEQLGPDVRVALVGVRIEGGDDEHAPEHMARTAAIDNLELSADALAPLAPDAVLWACTSGSFVAGLGHAREQAAALERRLGCAATSTSLAYVAALQALSIRRVSVLASYPAALTATLAAFLAEAGITVEASACLEFGSGPAAARVGDARLLGLAGELEVGPEQALLVPDTAIPTLHLLPALAGLHAGAVLTANQVGIWQLARLAKLDLPVALAGSLAAAA